MKKSKLMKLVNTSLKNNWNLILIMSDGLVFISDDNTGAFESENGLELNDPKYIEYYAAGIRMTKILVNPREYYIENRIIEISIEFNKPILILHADTGEVLWSMFVDDLAL